MKRKSRIKFIQDNYDIHSLDLYHNGTIDRIKQDMKDAGLYNMVASSITESTIRNLIKEARGEKQTRQYVAARRSSWNASDKPGGGR